MKKCEESQVRTEEKACAAPAVKASIESEALELKLKTIANAVVDEEGIRGEAWPIPLDIELDLSGFGIEHLWGEVASGGQLTEKKNKHD